MDQYKRIRIVGRGAHGMAMLCRKKRDASLVVVKELFQHDFLTEEDRRQSMNEIQVLSLLRHPNVIAYYDSFTADAETSESTADDPSVPLSDKEEAQHYRRFSDTVEQNASESNLSQNEVELAATSLRDSPRLKHSPSTLTSHYRGSLMIVMEYADGGTLADFVKKQQSPLTEPAILSLFAQLALALHHIHSHSILHRDLKPSNIFIAGEGPDMILKIGDFGISRALTKKSKAESVVGTPAYFSPELCEGKPYNKKSDIWALGCVLAELVCLKPIFFEEHLSRMVFRIMAANYERLPEEYSSDLRGLIDSMININPAKRPSMDDIVCLPFMQEYLIDVQMKIGSVNPHVNP